MNITFDQIRGPIERLVLVGLGWLAAKGVITSAEVANYATLVLALGAAFFGWWQNRPKAILQSAQALPEVTKIVSTNVASVADATLTKVHGS